MLHCIIAKLPKKSRKAFKKEKKRQIKKFKLSGIGGKNVIWPMLDHTKAFGCS